MEDLRPRALAQIGGQTEVVRRLHQLAEGARSGRIVPPNLLFHGPPGIGKTTAARAFAREVLGEHWESAFSTLEAYDDRGVLVMGRRIIPESRRPPTQGSPFRILFLDDADGIAPKAQNALRPALEAENGYTQFILAVNDLRRIALPLQSRCLRLEFRPLDPEALRGVVRDAVARTSLSVPDPMIESVISRSGGVPREAMKLLVEAFGQLDAAGGVSEAAPGVPGVPSE